MAVAPATVQRYADKLKWGASRKRSNGPISAAAGGARKPPLPPIFISTNPSHINLHELRDLYSSSNISCHRFPNVDSDGRVEPVDIHKLRIALRHSSVVVSVFCRPYDNDDCTAKSSPMMGLGDILQRAIPVTPSNGQLVGFGRAVSDQGLTASIYDIMVMPSLRRMGIGRMIVKRIVRILTSRDIFDIAALCAENERLFFQACGFGDDILGSTTMMYTRMVSSYPASDQMVKCAGRRVLLAPSLRQPFANSCPPVRHYKPMAGEKVSNSLPLNSAKVIEDFLAIKDKFSHRFLGLFHQRNSPTMGKIWIEVCLISARGLQRSSLWKLQWFAVGWVDPNNKYCTKIDASGNANPVWKTKFSTLVDDSESKFQDLALYVEVYSREPIFLREKLQGTATVNLKEFLAKHIKSSEASKPGTQDVGSFQLRKRKSSKPHGFVDISIRISEEREEPDSYSGKEEGFELMDHSSGITLAPADASTQAYPPQRPLAPLGQPQNPPQTNFPYSHPMPFPTNNSNPALGGPSYPSAGGTSYPPPRSPPPPPPPSNVGYIPTFLPRTDHLPGTYVNMPPSGSGAGSSRGPGFGMGVGAGALAAGAVIFGDDFMSGFDFPTGLQDASLTISTDPLF